MIEQKCQTCSHASPRSYNPQLIKCGISKGMDCTVRGEYMHWKASYRAMFESLNFEFIEAEEMTI